MANIFSWFNFRSKTQNIFIVWNCRMFPEKYFFFKKSYRAFLIILVIPICFLYLGSIAFKKCFVYCYSSMTLFRKHSPCAFSVTSENLHNLLYLIVSIAKYCDITSYLTILQSSGNTPRVHLVCIYSDSNVLRHGCRLHGCRCKFLSPGSVEMLFQLYN